MLDLLFKNSWVEIVFSNRNKEYGAYEIRQVYSRNVTVAFFAASTLFTLAITGPVIYDKWIKSAVVADDELEVKEIVLTQPPPLDPKSPPPPPPPPVPPPPKVASVKFLPPVVKPDEEVIEEPPTIKEMENKAISDVNQEGAAATGSEIIVEESGTGDAVIEEPVKEEEPVLFAEEEATLPGGLPAYLQKSITYPKQAIKMDITGKVFVQFVIEKDGAVTNVKVIRGIGYGCDEEAARAVASMPKWTPAKMNGRTVRRKMVIPVSFQTQ